MEKGEVEELCSHYEARLGATMPNTLGQAALQLYSGGGERVSSNATWKSTDTLLQTLRQIPLLEMPLTVPPASFIPAMVAYRGHNHVLCQSEYSHSTTDECGENGGEPRYLTIQHTSHHGGKSDHSGRTGFF